MQWWQNILNVFTSPYLLLWWALIALYLALYALCRGWVDRAQRETTSVYRCREALGTSFVVHLIATAIVLFYWWPNNFASKSFYLYLPLYLILAAFDLMGMISLFRGISRFRSYDR